MVSTLQQARQACPRCNTELREGCASGLCVSCLALMLTPKAATRSGAGEPGAPTLPDGFIFVAPLGRGGMGQVHLAYQPALRRYIALKQISGRWREHPKARERFIREAQAAAQLSHPGVVPVLEIGGDDECVWYTMEFLEGGDLSALLSRRGGCLPWREAVAIVEATARSIDHAHRAGVAHRDLKPSNVLLDANDKPKIADFGLAWLAGAEANELTMTGEILGTPAYLAPECLGPREHVDARLGDVYGLCALLFHLIAGRPPFVGDTPLQVLHAITHEPTPRLRQCAPEADVPLWLDRLCAHGLAKRPRERIASAHALAKALSTRQAGHGWRLSRHHRGVAALVVTLAAVGYGVTTFWIRDGADRRVPLKPSSAPPLSPGVSSASGAGTREANAALVPDKPAAVPKQGIAVLPFAIEGAGEELRIFAAGLQVDLQTHLSKIGGLRVISNRSVRMLGDSPRSASDIAALLGVAHIVEGSVRLERDRVRVTVQITDGANNVEEWREGYDRELTQTLNLQSEISIDVARNLRAELTSGLLADLRREPTRHPRAKELFDRARALLNAADQEVAGIKLAQDALQQALALDPDFSDAWALLSSLHTLNYSWGLDRTDRRLDDAYRAARKAVEIAPQSSGASVAFGDFFFRGRKDFALARRYYEKVLQQNPSDSDCISSLANIARREGRWDEATSHYQQAITLNPLDPLTIYNAADTLLRVHDFAAASHVLVPALTRFPNHPVLKEMNAELQLLWKGELQALRDDFATRPKDLPNAQIYLVQKIEWLILERRFAEALDLLRKSDFAIEEGQLVINTRDSLEAELQFLSGHIANSRDAAARAIRTVDLLRNQRPNDPRIAALLSQMLAIVGDKTLALREAERPFAPETGPLDAYDRGVYLQSKIIVLSRVGESDAALAALRVAMVEPGATTPALIRVAPAFDLLRGDKLDALLSDSSVIVGRNSRI